MPWICESKSGGGGPSLSFLIRRFSARLEGSSKWFVCNQHYRVIISFAPQREGLYEAILELTLCDHSRKADFVVKRTLSGRAVQPTGGQGDKQNKSERNTGSQPICNRADGHTRLPPFVEAELMDSDGTGISVSHAHGLDFGIVERKRSNGPFTTPSALLTIKHADGFPPVAFVKERTRTLDGSDPECVISIPLLGLNSQIFALGSRESSRVTLSTSILVQRALYASYSAPNLRVCSRQLSS